MKFLRIIGYLLLVVLCVLLIGGGLFYFKKARASRQNMQLLGEEASIIKADGLSFRDLNKNGEIDAYEDHRLPVEVRIDDLLPKMDVSEKAGCMFITMIGIAPGGQPMEKPFFSSNPMDIMMSLLLPSNSQLIVRQKLNSFNILSTAQPSDLAHYNNMIQKMAERTRLGIPITLASDPRHGIANNPGTAIFSPYFSQWPGFLGMAATRDTQLIEQFGQIARQEYMACGIRLALHPMADLATHPKWGRTSGTFGEDAHLAAMMVRSYIRGFQDTLLSANSVACMSKHFPGSGTNKHGHETHFPYGKEVHYSGNNFNYHLIPFAEGALKVKTAQVMTSYGIPVGQTSEDVAVAFNRDVVSGILRDSLGFDGVVCTDWNVISETAFSQRAKGGPSAWGVEDLTPKQRVLKALNAGIDQFGGEEVPHLIIELVKDGEISESRLDQSVRRILRDKFRLGLFDNPYVDEQLATSIAGKPEFRDAGLEAQRKSTVLLKNDDLLPLPKMTKIFWPDLQNPEVIEAHAQLVDQAIEADIIIKRIETPFDPKDDYFIESFMRLGRLHFLEEERAEILKDLEGKSSVIIINLDRPAIFPEINAAASAVIGEFGTSEMVLADILFGISEPTGKLPFELPSSPESVERQVEDVPYDSDDPLYPFGFGLTY